MKYLEEQKIKVRYIVRLIPTYNELQLFQKTTIITINLLLSSTIELYFCIFCNCLGLEWKSRILH